MLASMSCLQHSKKLKYNFKTSFFIFTLHVVYKAQYTLNPTSSNHKNEELIQFNQTNN